MTLPTLKTVRRAAVLAVVTAMVCYAGAAAFHASTSTNRDLGSVAHLSLNQPVVAIASTPSGNGYWLTAADGGVFTFGDAHYYGSTGKLHLAAPIVGIAPTPTGHGYWLVGSDGGIFTFGDAHFFGSTGRRKLPTPIVGIAATPTGNGYWLAARGGGVYHFGDAQNFGSRSHRRKNAPPVVGIASTHSGHGYWLAASDGTVSHYGDAQLGNATAPALSAPVVGIARQPGADGFWLTEADGSTLSFGGAHAYATQFSVGAPSVGNGNSVVTIAASPKGGYWVATQHGAVGVSTTQQIAKPSLKATGPIAYQLLQRMNAERVARHLTPFGWDRLLAQRANIWAHTLLATNQFKHQDLGTIANEADGRFEEVGENLFSGTGSAADAGTAHNALMHSPDHRANMLLPQGQLVGIAAVCSQHKLMVVEDFAIKMGAPLPPPNQPIPPLDPIVSPGEGGASC